MTAITILAAAGTGASAPGGVISMLVAAVSALTTALIFLYNRQTRSEARTQKALKDAAELCESEKVRMMDFTLKLIDYITALTKITCSYPQCPVRGAMPPPPVATPEDMGMRMNKK